MLRAPKPLRRALSLAAAAAIGLVPAVFIASPANAVPGAVDVDSDLESAEGDAFTFDLRRTGGYVDQPLTLNYTTVDGTATAGEDYTAISGTTSFPASSTRDVVKRFTVNGISDSRDENDEGFVLRFTDAATGGDNVLINANGILDDDDAVPSYALSVGNPVGEAAGNATITATLSAVSGRNVTIPFATSNGTAVAPGDYTTTSATITVQAGSTTGTANVPIIDDARDEEDTEAFTVVGSAGNHNEAVTGGPLTVNIADDDVLPTVSIAPGNATEGDAMSFTATLSAMSNRTVTVVANTADGTATASQDYTPVVSQGVTFNPGENSKTITVTSLGDSLNEVNPETLAVTLSAPVNALAGTMTATGGITDDDTLPTATLSPTTVAEGDSGTQVKTFTVTLDSASGRQVQVGYQVNGGTAVADEDFEEMTGGTLTFAPGDTEKTFTVGVVGDEVDEANETFDIVLSNPGTTLSGGGDMGSNTVTITDDDLTPTLVGVSGVTRAEGNASDTATFTVSVARPSAQAITLDVSALNGTAVVDGAGAGSNDFDAPESTVTIQPGNTTATISVTVNGDTVFEGDEQATIRASVPGDESDVTGGPVTATLRLNNDDAVPTVALIAAAAAEGGSINVTATVTGIAQADIAVNLAVAGQTTDGSDPAEPGDFNGGGLGAQTIPAGSHAGAVPLGSIAVEADAIDELPETVQVTLTSAVVTTASQFYTITDDPTDLPPTITIGDVTVGEATGTANVPVTQDFSAPGNNATSTARTVTARYATTDGTARAPGDYTAAANDATVTFAPGETSKNVSVTIENDTVYEHAENLTVGLSSLAPAEVTFTGGDSSATVTINDNDSDNKPSFSVADVSFTEGAPGTANFAISLGAVTTAPIEFVVAVEDGTAKHELLTAGGDDFEAPLGTATVPAGQSSVTIPVTVNDDTVDEPTTETATLKVRLADDENDAVGEEDSSTLTITDNDAAPTATLSAASAAEGGSIAVTATVTGVAQNAIPITLAATGDVNAGSNPAEGGDFNAAGLTATSIPAGATGQVALGTIAASNDTADEADETVRVTMSGGVTASQFQTITDDPNDLSPTVAVGDVTVGEASGPASVPVTLSFGAPGNAATSTEQTVTVRYATVDGTARAPADYTAAVANATVTFTPGVTSRNISVTLENDSVFERSETLTVVLSSPTPEGVVIADASATVTITDNDSDNKPTFSLGPVEFTEGDAGTANFTVQLATATTEQIDFTVTQLDGTAKHDLTSAGGDDFELLESSTFSIPAGQSSVTVPVTVNNDVVYESTESATLKVRLADGEDDAVGPEKSATLTITDNEDAPTVVLNTQSGSEGTDLAVIATVTGVAQADMVFDLTFAGDDSEGNNPAEPADYEDSDLDGVIPGGTVSGRSVRLRTVPLSQDDIDEPTETIRVTAEEDNDMIDDLSTTYRIGDDPNDLPPSVSISDESIGEAAGSVDLTVSLLFDDDTTSTEQDIVVPWNTIDGPAKAGLDYTTRSGTLTIPAGTTSETISVPILADTLFEGDQTFEVKLGVVGPKGAEVVKAFGEVTIDDDDAAAAPTLTAPANRVGVGLVTLAGVVGEGAQVQLYAARVSAGNAFTAVQTTTANATGNYSFTRTVDVGYRFYARADNLNSPVRTITVTQVPTMVGSSPARGTVTLSVTGNPKAAGQMAFFQRGNANGTWSNVAHGTLGSTGTFAATLRNLPSGASYYYRVVITATPAQGILAGASAARRVTVR